MTLQTTDHGELFHSLDPVPLEALQGFADHEHLAHLEEHDEQAEVIATAAEQDEKVAVDLELFLEEQWIERTVGEFEKFKVKTPPAAGFCAAKGLLQGPLVFLHDQIRQALREKRCPRRDVVDYLDGLRESGRQHVFLYRLKSGGEHRAYLRDLAEPQLVEQSLSKAHRSCFVEPSDCELPDGDEPLTTYGDHEAVPYIDEAPSPRLALVSLRQNRTLVVKWVESRASGVRAVNFLFVNLGNGNAELRIQKIEKQPQRELERSVTTYRQLVAKVVKLEHFVPLMVEPAIRKMLLSKRYRPISWVLEKPGRKQLLRGRGGSPSFLHLLMVGLRQFFAVSIETLFQVHGGETKRVALYGKTDEIRIRWEVEPPELAQILGRIRGKCGQRVLPTDGRQRGPIEVGKLLHYLRRSETDRLSLGELQRLATSMLEPFKKLVRFLESGAPGIEELADVRFYVRCPNARRPVRVDGSPVEYEKLAEIPASVDCMHARGVLRRHPSQGNTWIRFPRLGKAPIAWWEFIGLIALIALTTAVYVFLVGWVVDGWLGKGGLTAGFLLMLVLEVGLARRLMGEKAFNEAVKVTFKFYGQSQESPVDGLLDSAKGRGKGAAKKRWWEVWK